MSEKSISRDLSANELLAAVVRYGAASEPMKNSDDHAAKMTEYNAARRQLLKVAFKHSLQMAREKS